MRWIFWTAVLLPVLIAGIAADSIPPLTSQMPPDLQTAIDSFYTAIETDNIEARIALFADDAIIMPNHWTPTRGREAIAAMLRNSDGWVFRLRNREVLDFDIDSCIAYMVNSYEYTWHAETAEPQWHRTKNVHVWKRDHAGNWRLQIDIWNSDVSMSVFSTE